jgi:hypothetical protein
MRSISEYARREDFAISEVIPGLAEDDVRDSGSWWTTPGVWQRYDQPWPDGSQEPGPALHLGTIRSIYDTPQRYSVTIFRASITPAGLQQGWTVEALCDDALRHAGLTLANCPRAELNAPPPPLRSRPTPPPRN